MLPENRAHLLAHASAHLSVGMTMEDLPLRECWRLAVSGTEDGVGRIGFIAPDGGPDIVPINYIVTRRQIYCRTSPGTKATAIMKNPQVAFEVDGTDGVKRWSVVFRGVAWRMEDESEIYDSGITGADPLVPLPTTVFLRIAPLRVSGRRFTARVENHS